MVKCFFIGLLLMFSSTSMACRCPLIKYFDPVLYDFEDNIFEVTIDSLIEPVIEDTVALSSGVVVLKYAKFKVTINEVYKGELQIGDTVMTVYQGNNCSSMPRVGSTFIMYDDLNGFYACSRTLSKSALPKDFRYEQAILRLLRAKPDTVNIMLNGQLLVEGRHNNGKRDGLWKVYTFEGDHEVVYELKYEKGEFLGIATGPGFDAENRLHLSVIYSYDRDMFMEKYYDQF
jgi:hypothetical protein